MISDFNFMVSGDSERNPLDTKINTRSPGSFHVK